MKYGTFFGGTSTLSPVFGLRPFARLAPAKAETAEPPQLDLLAAMERGDDAAKDRVDDHLGVLLGEIRDTRDFLHELGLRHAPAERRSNLLIVIVHILSRGPLASLLAARLRGPAAPCRSRLYAFALK